MKYAAVILLSSVIGTQSFPAVAQPRDDLPDESQTTNYELPVDPATPVVSINVLGGNRSGQPLTEAPTLSILADGTVLLPAKWKGQQAINGKISSVELQQLLDFIISTNSFFSYEESLVNEKVRQASGGLGMGGPPPTTYDIQVTTKGESQKVSAEYRQFTWGVKELESINAIYHRLYKLEWKLRHPPKVDEIVEWEITPAETAMWLEKANQELDKKHPCTESLSTEHLGEYIKFASGKMRLSFTRYRIGSTNDQTEHEIDTSVILTVPANGGTPGILIPQHTPFHIPSEVTDEIAVNTPMVNFELPNDPTTPVVTWNQQGGYRLRAPLTDAPSLSILADGTVLIPAKWEGQQAFKSKINAVELQQLLDFIISRKEFFNYNAHLVVAKIKEVQTRYSCRQWLSVSGGETTVIQVTANGRTHEVKRYMLESNPWAIKELDQLSSIDSQLRQLMTKLRTASKQRTE